MVNGLQIPLNTLLCSPLFFYRNRDQQSGKQQVKQQRWILTGLSQCLKRNQKDEAEECCRSEVWINILHVVVRLCLRQSRLICLSSVSICLRLWLHWTFTHHKTHYMYSCLLWSHIRSFSVTNCLLFDKIDMTMHVNIVCTSAEVMIVFEIIKLCIPSSAIP